KLGDLRGRDDLGNFLGLRVHLHRFLLRRDLDRGGSCREPESCVHGGDAANCDCRALLEIVEPSGRTSHSEIAGRQAGNGISALAAGDGVAGHTSIETFDGDVCVRNDGASVIVHGADNGSSLYLRDAGGTEEQKSNERPSWALIAGRARVTAQKG